MERIPARLAYLFTGPKRPAEVDGAVFKEYTEEDLHGLRELHLSDLDREELAVFNTRAVRHLGRLEELHIASTTLGPEEITLIGRNVVPRLPVLHTLFIPIDLRRADGVKLLVEEIIPYARQVTHLGVLPPVRDDSLDDALEPFSTGVHSLVATWMFAPSEKGREEIADAIGRHMFGLKEITGAFGSTNLSTFIKRNEWLTKWAVKFYSWTRADTYKNTDSDFRRNVDRHTIYGTERLPNQRGLEEGAAFNMPFVKRERLRQFRNIYNHFREIDDEVVRGGHGRAQRDINSKAYQDFVIGVLNKYRFR